MTSADAEKISLGDDAKGAIGNPPLPSSSPIQHGVATEFGLPVSKDIGEDLFREIDDYTPEELEAKRIRVRKLIDWRIMPIICITYTIQFLDKLSLNYASAYSLIPDLGLQGQKYSWVAAIFNFGYLFWAIPANLLIQRLPIAKYTGTMIICWAVLLIAHVGAKNYAGMLVLRFLLGMFEASISPAIMNICSMFYTRDEQPLRMCIFLAFNGMATMVGALLGFGLGHAPGTALKSWQLIFLTIGLMNFVWGAVFLWFMPDSPATAKFLTHKQRVIAVKRVAENMVGVKTKQFKTNQVLEAITDVKVIAIALMGLACGVINGGVSNFSSALIKGYGFTGLNATLLQLPTGAFEFFIVPICGLVATYVRNTRCFVLAGVCLIPLGGLIGIRFTGLDHRWTLVGCTWLQYIVGAPVIISWNLLTTNIAGHTKRSLSNGLWFVFYAGGNVAGANIFFAKEAPRYYSALAGLSICYGGMIVVSLALRGYMMWENKRRDNACERRGSVIVASENGWRGGKNGKSDSRAIEDGFRDLTDRESPYFR
ncbi:DNA replication licensing factor [Venturia nashicola]|uniref:DNA replication licensing factor n=1 Tax=Venturia nashicola TaxID=86259 RepID=A0A4Z1PB63_9PEZI|nr:DNA replication licensing factor [Venturia nashicola]TLD35045.1 DNA replication licensing factor [Venturia nashicola]